LNFFDFAWSTVTQITKKSHNELKILLHDDLRYPYLGKDIRGFVLHLIKPKRLSEKCVYFHGLKFDLQNPTHKKIIWYLFKSSVYHLALHSHLSDFSVYSKWAQGKSHNLSTFVISLIEDAIINEHLKRSFRWMLPEIAYANAISFLLMKDIDKLPNDISQAMASILQEYALGKVKGKLKDDVLMDVKAITSILRGIRENLTEDSRVDAANKIYDALTVYGEPFEVPSLLHAECHGTNDLFYEQHIPREEDIQPIFTDALNIFESESKS
jgi:hypothetical protein